MNLDAQVKNKFNISEILKKLLLRVNKLENTSSNKNFIPLTGTEEGKYVRGPIVLNDGVSISFINSVNDGTYSKIFSKQGNLGFYTSDESNFIKGGISVSNDSERGTVVSVFDNANFENFEGIQINKDVSGVNPNNKFLVAQRSYVDKSNSYSTEETKTEGTWIDGKPIYRKVIQFILPNGAFVSDLTSLNIEHCLKCSANLLYDDSQSINEQLWVSQGAVSQFYSKVIFPNSLEVACMMTEITTGEISFNNAGMSGSVILEYTKTTD